MSNIDAFIHALAHPCETEIFAVRRIVLDADPSITESIKWNAPSFATTDHFATFHLRAKSGVQLILHLGAKPQPHATVRAATDEPSAGLVWKSADRAVMTFATVTDVEQRAAALTRVVQVWIRHIP
jgi:Domain of unknown function (DU1801)